MKDKPAKGTPTLPATSMNVQNFKNELLKTWDTLPPCFVTSSEKNNGRDAVLNFIENELHAYSKRAKKTEN